MSRPDRPSTPRRVANGTLRGTVSTASRLRETGFDDLVCTSPASSFVAAP